MAEEIKVGLVIKIMDFDDTDQIVSILTNNETITLIAKGTRKITSKNRVAIQLGNIIEFSFFRARLSNKLSRLKKAVLIKQPPITQNNIAKTILEMLVWLNKVEHPTNELFLIIIQIFNNFGKNKEEWLQTFLLFHLTSCFGVKINNRSCVECDSFQDIADVRFYSGGFLCKKHKIKERDINFLKGVYNLNTIELFLETDLSTVRQIKKELLAFIREQQWI